MAFESMAKLTRKQQRFVEEYLIDCNSTQAAIRAGYSQKTAGRIGTENVQKPVIRAAIDKAMLERSERIRVDSDYVLQRLVDIDQMSVADILDERGVVKAVSEWPKIWQQFLSGMDVSEMWEGSGDEKITTGLLKKIKWPDKLKNLELMGRHVNVQAFNDKRTLDLGESTQDILKSIVQAIDGTSKGLPNE